MGYRIELAKDWFTALGITVVLSVTVAHKVLFENNKKD